VSALGRRHTFEALAVIDEDGDQVVLDGAEASALYELTGGLEDATVSACPSCRSRVIACLAFVELLDRSSPHPRGAELIELADEAPSSHCYVQDLDTQCRHPRWLDPGRLEWLEVVSRLGGPPPGPRR
jgi:hypothetical protein